MSIFFVPWRWWWTTVLAVMIVMAVGRGSGAVRVSSSSANTGCVNVSTTDAEFYAVFASQFRMSDGSAMDPSSVGDAAKARLFATRFMRNVGATVYPDRDLPAAFTIEMCGADLLRNALLAVVGNYVSNPGDVELSPVSSTQAVPVVVVDTYTGGLMTHVAYSGVRGYFVEALLVVSIVVIARLTFVRNTPYFTFVPASVAVAAPAGETVK